MIYRDLLSRNLIATRKQLGLTQEAAAERCGISIKHLRDIELRKVSPTLDMLEKLTSGLDTHLDQLIPDSVSQTADDAHFV